ncbi:hypothetical protein AK812_SmicGene48799, partial [Symbiodinium microadriaticum]
CRCRKPGNRLPGDLPRRRAEGGSSRPRSSAEECM